MAGIDSPVTQEQLLKALRLAPTDRLLVDLHGKENEEFLLNVVDEKGEGHFPSQAARYDFPARFPERHEMPASYGTRWRVPATDITAILISRLWKSEQVRFTPAAKIVFQFLLLTVTQQHSQMRRTASYHEFTRSRKELEAVPYAVTPTIDADNFALKNGHKPMLHQRVALANTEGTDAYAFFMEQGTGKTLPIIAEIDREAGRVQKRMHRTLIVAPKNVRQNWVNEINRFSAKKGKAVVLRGGAIKRMKQLIEALVPTSGEEYTVIIISYECLSNSWDILGKIEWDLAVLDEAHFIKSPKTKRSQFAMKLREVAKSRRALTGTPVCNSTMDLYSQLEFLRKGGSGFKSFEAFKNFYGVYQTRDSHGIKRLVDVQNLPFMRERLARMAFIVRKEEALPDLPDKVYDIHEVEMTEEQVMLYETLQTQLFLEIKDELDDTERQVNVNNVLTKLLRLAQITSGFVTLDPIVDLDSGETVAPKVINRIDPNPKVEAVVELLKDESKTPDDKTLIWACWVEDIRAISARLTLEGIDHVTFYGRTGEEQRQENERRYNSDPNCRVFVGNPACGGTGLNLVGYDYWNVEPTQTTNTTHEIFFSQGWSSSQRSQCEDRGHRRGTRCHVRMTDLCVPETIDEEIRNRVTNKRTMALEVQDLRTVLSKVLGRAL